MLSKCWLNIINEYINRVLVPKQLRTFVLSIGYLVTSSSWHSRIHYPGFCIEEQGGKAGLRLYLDEAATINQAFTGRLGLSHKNPRR